MIENRLVLLILLIILLVNLRPVDHVAGEDGLVTSILAQELSKFHIQILQLG